MKNNEAQQIETTLSDDALAATTVKDMGKVMGIVKSKAATLPVVRPQGPVFPGMAFGYDTRPFKDPH